MFKRFIISFFIITLTSFYVFSQSIQIKGIILDIDSGKPIETAFVFINNTSYGTETMVDGKFNIECSNEITGDLIISHINYRSVTLNFSRAEEIPDTIRLVPESVVLDEVRISDIKGKDRKKWLKKFKKSFLGDDGPDKIEILNPDDILFSETNDTFVARAANPLRIKNHSLGYHIRFYLEQFIMLDNRVTYSGKAFFEEMEIENNDIVDAREKEYFQSTRYFLTKLIEDAVPTNFYDCHKVEFTTSWDYKVTGKYDIQENVYQLYNSGYYVLTVPDALLVNGYGNLKSRSFSYTRNNISSKASFLIPKSHIIIFNKNGVIINFKEVEEIGFWATKRISSMLPLNYTPPSQQNATIRYLDWVPLGFIANTVYADDSISGRLRADGMLINPVNLFLHTDRSVYMPGETIWFSIYGRRNKSRLFGNYGVAVELINKFKEIETFKIIPTDDGLGKGYIDLPDSLAAGEYLLRYYLINNGIESIYSEAPISIVSKDESKGHNMIGSATQLTDSVYIRFFPEGGELIDGLKTKVAYEVTDAKGNYIDFIGELVAEKSENAVPIKTLYKGMGYFQLIPIHSETYHITALENGLKLSFQFPEITPVGGVMSASTKLEDFIKISVQLNDSSSVYRLLGHADGIVFSDHEFYTMKEVFLFNKNYLPTGVLHFTLFNETNKPIAERLVFNDFNYHNDLLEVKPLTSYFRKKSQVSIDIFSNQWKDIDSLAYLSISVTDDKLYDPTDMRHNITSEWYINNRLDFLIPDLPHLLNDIGHKERFLMDLYMMVRGWRRFRWDDFDQFDNHLNQGVNIKGVVESDKSDIKVVVSNFSNPFYYDEQEVTGGPSFNFSFIPISAGSSFILQLKEKDNDKLVKIDKGAIRLDSITPSQIEPRLKLQYQSILNTDHKPLIDNTINKLKQDSLLEFSFNVDLEEVLIKEKRERDVRRFGLNDISKIEWIDPRTPSRNLISRMRPSTRVMNSATGRLQFELINDQGFNERVNAIIVIDGTIHYDGTRYLNLAKFNSLTADQILYYGVNPPVITIYTDPNGPRSLQNQKSNIYTYHLPGLDDYMEFYRPVFDAGDLNPDFRTTIHWEPNITLKKGKKVNVNFYSGDEDANYTYVIQGMTSTGTPILNIGKLKIKE